MDIELLADISGHLETLNDSIGVLLEVSMAALHMGSFLCGGLLMALFLYAKRERDF